MISAALALLETDEQRNILSEFYKANKHRLFGIAYSRLHNKESAEDAVQDVFLRLAKDARKFFGLSDRERVMYADVIARNVTVDMYRRANKLYTTELSEDISENGSDNPLEAELLYRFTKEKLTELLNGLPPLQRDVLFLRTVHDMTVKEIAEKLSVSENTVRQRLFRARNTIKEALEREGI